MAASQKSQICTLMVGNRLPSSWRFWEPISVLFALPPPPPPPHIPWYYCRFLLLFLIRESHGELKNSELEKKLQAAEKSRDEEMDALRKKFAAELEQVKKDFKVKKKIIPAPVAQWLARRTVGRKVWGSNPIRVMWDFSALAGSYPELGVLWAQWEGWNHTAELHPLNGCVFEGVALIIWPTLQVPQFPGLVNTGIIVTVSMVCGPVK